MRGEEDRMAGDTDKEFSVRGSQCRRVILFGGIQELSSVGRIVPRDSRGDPGRRARYTSRARLRNGASWRTNHPGGLGLPRGNVVKLRPLILVIPVSFYFVAADNARERLGMTFPSAVFRGEMPKKNIMEEGIAL